MELGIDVNLRAKATGYTFIQLAIYGYNVAEEEYSYSTDYILKLIELAKNYRLKVNLIESIWNYTKRNIKKHLLWVTKTK